MSSVNFLCFYFCSHSSVTFINTGRLIFCKVKRRMTYNDVVCCFNFRVILFQLNLDILQENSFFVHSGFLQLDFMLRSYKITYSYDSMLLVYLFVLLNMR